MYKISPCLTIINFDQNEPFLCRGKNSRDKRCFRMVSRALPNFALHSPALEVTEAPGTTDMKSNPHFLGGYEIRTNIFQRHYNSNLLQNSSTCQAGEGNIATTPQEIALLSEICPSEMAQRNSQCNGTELYIYCKRTFKFQLVTCHP